MKAVAYYRTSSQTNVGWDKDSESRQRDAVMTFARKNGYNVEREFYDAGVPGADPIDQRDGFCDMLDYIEKSGIRAILIETANRFARDLAVQITGHKLLMEMGIDLIPVDCPQHFKEDTPTAELVRQILGAISEFEKASLVSRLRKARERKRKESGRCEGRKPVPHKARSMAVLLHGQGKSYREISKKLASKGFMGPSGEMYHAGSIRHMIIKSGQEKGSTG